MITDRGNQELKRKAAKQTVSKIQDPKEALRMKCLARGANGILGLGRQGHPIISSNFSTVSATCNSSHGPRQRPHVKIFNLHDRMVDLGSSPPK